MSKYYTEVVLLRTTGVRMSRKLDKYIEELCLLRDEVPEEYRDSVEIRLGGYESSPDYVDASVKVSYRRPMTADEESEYVAKRRGEIRERIVREEELIEFHKRELNRLDDLTA